MLGFACLARLDRADGGAHGAHELGGSCGALTGNGRVEVPATQDAEAGTDETDQPVTFLTPERDQRTSPAASSFLDRQTDRQIDRTLATVRGTGQSLNSYISSALLLFLLIGCWIIQFCLPSASASATSSFRYISLHFLTSSLLTSCHSRDNETVAAPAISVINNLPNIDGRPNWGLLFLFCANQTATKCLRDLPPPYYFSTACLSWSVTQATYRYPADEHLSCCPCPTTDDVPSPPDIKASSFASGTLLSVFPRFRTLHAHSKLNIDESSIKPDLDLIDPAFPSSRAASPTTAVRLPPPICIPSKSDIALSDLLTPPKRHRIPPSPR